MSTYTGKNIISIGNPRLVEFILAMDGYAPSASTHAMNLFYHGEKGTVLTEDDAPYTGADKSPLTHAGKKVTMSWPIYSSDMLMLKNLIAFALGKFNAFGKDENGRFHNYVPVTNSDYETSPDGSLVSPISLVGTKWTNNEKERKIDFMGNAYTFPELTKWKTAQSTGYITTGQVASGNSAPIGVISNARAARVKKKGFHTVTRLSGVFGDLAEAGIVLEFVSDGGELQLNSSVVRGIKATLTAKTKTLTMAQVDAAMDDSVTDGSIVYDSFAGESMTFNNMRGTTKVVDLANDYGYIEGHWESIISLTAVDFTSLNSPIFTANQL